jgi:hypothetical protein
LSWNFGGERPGVLPGCGRGAVGKSYSFNKASLCERFIPFMSFERVMDIPEHIRREVDGGRFRNANALINNFLRRELPSHLRKRLEREKEKIRRLALEYPYDREEAMEHLNGEIRDFAPEELDKWICRGIVDRRVIEDEERFQKRFIPNLFFADERIKRRRLKEDKEREEMRALLHSRIDEILQTKREKEYVIRARITLELKRPRKDHVRCWLPFPRVGCQIKEARLMSASHDHHLSTEDAPQRTIYFEERARKFFVEFEYVISEQYTEIDPDRVPSEVPRQYLEEQPPHIVFTPYVRSLAAEITGDEDNPYLKAMKMYDWITTNVRYSYVREYGTYENISEFCLTNLRGDCGVQALAFITLCRAAGVPAKWESGWYVTPKFAGNHDWALFYAGEWLHADCSFGGSRRKQERYRKFYFGNLDAFRMIANSELGGDFTPPKRHWRSDPCDNQRGEAETEKGNIYYNQFETRTEVISFKEKK